MDNVKILEVKQSIFASNDEQAAALRAELKQEKIFLLNLMSAPGSGKTTTLRRTIAALQNELRIGVMEADIEKTYPHFRPASRLAGYGYCILNPIK